MVVVKGACGVDERARGIGGGVDGDGPCRGCAVLVCDVRLGGGRFERSQRLSRGGIEGQQAAKSGDAAAAVRSVAGLSNARVGSVTRRSGRAKYSTQWRSVVIFLKEGKGERAV